MPTCGGGSQHMTEKHSPCSSTVMPTRSTTTASGGQPTGRWPRTSPASSSSKPGESGGRCGSTATRSSRGYWPWRTTVCAMPNGPAAATTGSWPNCRRPEDTPPLDAQASDRVDDEVTMRRLLLVLRQLNTEDQEVIALCDWSGLSYEEAATALDIPVGTVKSRLSRARTRLRALMDPAGAGR